MKLTGAQIVIECLKEQGVDTIFGYPGAATINIYDELYKNAKYIQHILTSHEQGAAHAADGYSRSSDRIGVCIATSGPGATNLVTGIATAYMDSIPMVAITGNVDINKLGKDSFQEVDIFGITMPITKHNYMIKDVNDLAPAIREAFLIAKSGRPGPVLIDIPKNITAELAEFEREEPKEIVRVESKMNEKVLELIKNAKRPMIYAGGGVKLARASEELIAFAEMISAPVACSLMSIGSIPTDHKLYTGMVGMHGTMVSNTAFNRCDLLICIGARFSDRVVGNENHFVEAGKIIHFDIDPAEINKNILVDDCIIGDVKNTLAMLLECLTKQQHTDWLEEINKLKTQFKITYDRNQINVPYLLKKIGEHAGEEDIVSTDVGQHQMWTAQHYPFKKPYKLLTSGGLGTMGYGLGAAMGAQFANKDNRIIMITGDGSFKMNFNEIVTSVRHKLPIKIFLMNNHTLGMVRQWQDLFYDQRFAATTLEDDIDYVQFARSLGGEGYTIDHISEIDAVIEEAFSNDKLCLIHCNVPQSQFVYPMVPPGKAIHEAIWE
ncbi:MAG: acetolactate synthase, large subunit, biosynthetic type [Firmicutes bacterium HGW-Firmicutes-7]|nr:MAG: acetolactate synthase, large subunit, biosynthetic type [Firmicutes bacterium HGW-Firmicutes-7]